MLNLHGTLVSLRGKGILILGSSGSGKSDLALRLIMEKGAVLIADDRVNLFQNDGRLFGSAPAEIFGKMEIRGVGIASFSAQPQAEINICLELCRNKEDVERLPVEEKVEFLGVSVTKLKIYPFECSTICKIVAKISGIICSAC